jgi:YHS domain-containing protein
VSTLPADVAGVRASRAAAAGFRRVVVTAPAVPMIMEGGDIMAKDDVCGMEVNAKEAEARGLSTVFQGQEYYFCSAECKTRFEENPELYTRKKKETAGRP